MSVRFKLPNINDVVDKQFFQVPGPDGILQGFQVDKETSTFYKRESQVVIPSHHGFTHIDQDPIPDATCDAHGLMASEDKCKLDALLQTRVGILGFQGAGFPDDGGFIVGDFILAAGSEFISLERVGNTVRFNVESPIPLNCGCESCAQIFWIQDESEARSIRPPSCNGVMPNVSAYGELKIYLLPESIIVDPQDPMDVLKNKGNYPTYIFKRYDDGETPFEAEIDIVLKRNTNLTADVGWAFTPGALVGSTPVRAECVWKMGKDKAGGQIKYELFVEAEQDLLGSILYKGNLITKMPAIITGYTSTSLTGNRYTCKKWDLRSAKTIGNSFTAQNIWRYFNPENKPTDPANPQQLILDSTVAVLPTGTLIDIYEFEVSRSSNERITVAFFIKEPQINSEHLWSLAAAVRFGDLFTAREEINDPISGTAITASEMDVSDIRLFERTIWGINGFEDRLIISDDGKACTDSAGNIVYEPSGEPINNDIVADIDPTIPGLRILKQASSDQGDIDGDGIVTQEDLRLFACAYGARVGEPRYKAEADFNEDGIIDVRDLAIIAQHFDLSIEKVLDQPIFLWHRGNHGNALIKAKLGMPNSEARHFPPYDFLLSAPVDSFDDTYIKVIRRGIFCNGPFAGAPFIVVKGLRWRDLPQQGVLRILSGAFRNYIWRFYFKVAYSSWDDDAVVLVGRDNIFPFNEDFPVSELANGSTACTFSTDVTNGSGPEVNGVPLTATVVELLRSDFTAPAVRLQFDVNYGTDTEAVQLQVIVGMLDMSVAYPLNDATDPSDDLVRGFAPGYTVSAILIQQGFITDGIGSDVQSNPEAFRVYTGGELAIPVDGQTEKWNELEIMYRDGQAWIFWNCLLISPDPTLCSRLPTPVAINSPYFPLVPQIDRGKIALRMFPGAIVRSMEIRDQLEAFNEFSCQQMEIVN